MTDPLTAEEIAAIEARANAATPGPWTAEHRLEDDYAAEVRAGTDTIADLERSYDERDMVDAAFIAASRTDIPALIATLRAREAELALWRSDSSLDAQEVRALREQLARAVELLRKYHACPFDMPVSHFEEVTRQIAAFLATIGGADKPATFPALPIDPEADKLVDGLLNKARGKGGRT